MAGKKYFVADVRPYEDDSGYRVSMIKLNRELTEKERSIANSIPKSIDGTMEFLVLNPNYPNPVDFYDEEIGGFADMLGGKVLHYTTKSDRYYFGMCFEEEPRDLARIMRLDGNEIYRTKRLENFSLENLY